MQILRLLIYVAAITALWQGWSSSPNWIWWPLLVLAVLMFWTTGTVKLTVQDAAKANPLIAENPGLAAHDLGDASTEVVRFWVKANIAITFLTLLIALYVLVSLI